MISIDASFIAVFFMVWILVVFLTKVFFNPLRKIMTERKIKIETNLQAADKDSKSLEQISLQIEESLKTARVKSQALREKFEQEGLKEKQRILDEVNMACRNEVEAAKVKLERQIRDIKKEMEAKSRDFALEIEKKLLN